MYPLIDIHAHIDQHDADELPGILDRARTAGVVAVLTSGVTVESSMRGVDLARRHAGLFAGVGVHPEDMFAPMSDQDVAVLNRLAADPHVLVMSEIGLDHSDPVSIAGPDAKWMPSTSPDWWGAQEAAFRAQIRIAKVNGLAIVFHNRNATADVLRVLRDELSGHHTGAAHYFQGDWEYATALLDLGLYLSFARPLVRSKELREIAKRVPADRIVLETDSYPQRYKPDRNKWTEPKDLALIANALAGITGRSLDEVSVQTTENTLRMLGQRGEPIRRAVTDWTKELAG